MSNFPTSQDNLSTTHADYTERLTALTVNGIADAVNATQSALLNGMKVLDKGGQVVNVNAYGGKGDGVTDNTPAITNAIAALPAMGGVLLFQAGGKYLYTSQLSLSGKPIIVTGGGRDLDGTNAPTELLYQPTTTGTAAISVLYNGCGVRDLVLKQNNATGTTDGISVAGVFNCNISNVTVTSFTGNGVKLASTVPASCIWNRGDQLRITACGTGLLLQGSTPNAKSCNSNTFTGCQITGNTGLNVSLGDTANENGFFGCDVSVTSGTTLVQVGDATHSCRGNVFWQTTAEGGTTGFNVQANSSSTVIHAEITAATKVNWAAGVTGWFYDTIGQTWSTNGNVGLRFDTNGNIGMGAAAPTATGINGPNGWGLLASGTQAAAVFADRFQINKLPAFVASDKYLVVDGNGNVHVSALGPAS